VKKAISIWSFHPEWSFEKKLRVAKEAGFEGIEIDLTLDGPVTLESTAEDLSRVRSLAENIGISLSGLATGLYWDYNPASDDADVRERAATVLNRQIECAAELGIDSILVVPGAVGADFIPNAEAIPYDVAYHRAEQFLRKVLPHAEKHNVTLCVENVWNKFLLSPLEMKSFVDAFENPLVRVYFDAGNVLATGYPEHWINILGDRIQRVHLKDYRRGVGTVDGFVDLLSGDVNWPAVVTSLQNIGYTGWVAAEMIPPLPFYKFAPETLIYNTSRAMDSILALGDQAGSTMHK
jgi:L-ribulose-5-phosphate 3-epimerase